MPHLDFNTSGPDEHDQQPSSVEPDPLSPEDQAALDALVDAHFVVDEVVPALRSRARAIAATLGLLDTVPVPPGALERLIAGTLRRVDQVRTTPSPAVGPDHPSDAVTLSPADEDALEALVQAGFEPGSVAGGMRERARHQAALLGLLGAGPSFDADERTDLVRRTLMYVQSEADAERSRMRVSVDPAARVTTRRFRLRDLATIAAVLVLGAATLWPMTDWIRARARQTATIANLGIVGRAVSSYAASNAEQLPSAAPSQAGAVWWNVGRLGESNSANWYTLVRTGFARVCQLASPGNPYAVTVCEPGWIDWPTFESISFSFLNLFGNDVARAQWRASPMLAIAADRSPVVVRAYRRERLINVLENSLNHAGRGQAVLMADASTHWLERPVLANGDNIWLPRAIEQALKARPGNARSKCDPLKGTETPAGADDSFLCP